MTLWEWGDKIKLEYTNYRPQPAEDIAMNRAISTNSKDEYFSDLINRYGFSYAQRGNVTTLTAPKELGSGYIKTVQVSDDIEISIIDLFLMQPIVSHYDDYPNTCEATYCFSGHISYSETGVVKTSLEKNEMGLYALPHSCGTTTIPAGERVFVVSVESKESFHSRFPCTEKNAKYDESSVKELLHQLVKPRKVNVKIHNYFSQIIENDIDCELKDTYLDSLGKVLLSDLWQENIIFPLAGRKEPLYSSYEKKALLEAQKILSDNYASPPTIPELAKKVALNEYKLKTGFRDMYGKSIYEYVRGLRMENASRLLENMDLSISEIAGMVGYVNTSHFASAFRNKYGLNPSDFRLGV